MGSNFVDQAQAQAHLSAPAFAARTGCDLHTLQVSCRAKRGALMGHRGAEVALHTSQIDELSCNSPIYFLKLNFKKQEKTVILKSGSNKSITSRKVSYLHAFKF